MHVLKINDLERLQKGDNPALSLCKQVVDSISSNFLNVLYCVRRAKARFSSGCESRPATFVPAGSNRSSRGGNEAAEASGVEGRNGDLASL